MTTVTGSDGKTYTFENGVLTISGSGEANAMRSGSITGLDASTMHTLIVESGITSLGQELMFRGCTGLTSVTLPEGLTNIGSYDFMECTNLASIRLPSTLTNLAGYVFYGCTKLAEIIFTGNQPSIRDLALSTNRSSGTTIYSTGWANSTTITSTVTGSTVMTFVDSVPMTYKRITLDGSKIQVDSAVRDGQGQRIDTGYQKKNIIVSNTTVSSWSSDNTYSDYPYRASIAITGVTASDTAEVVFAVAQATSGDYAPVCETYAGGVYIYSAVNDSITVPTIIIFKG